MVSGTNRATKALKKSSAEEKREFTRSDKAFFKVFFMKSGM